MGIRYSSDSGLAVFDYASETFFATSVLLPPLQDTTRFSNRRGKHFKSLELLVETDVLGRLHQQSAPGNAC